MTLFDEKNCECGHSKQDHLWNQKGVTKIAFLGEGFFRVPQEERGLCKQCTCPKFLQPRLLRTKRKIQYLPRDKNPYGSENRCSKCGRLLENHENAGHSFEK